MGQGISKRRHGCEVCGYLMPGTIILLKPEFDLSVLGHIYQRCFPIGGVMGIVEDVKSNLEAPFVVFSGCRPGNLILSVVSLPFVRLLG